MSRPLAVECCGLLPEVVGPPRDRDRSVAESRYRCAVPAPALCPVRASLRRCSRPAARVGICNAVSRARTAWKLNGHAA